MGNRIAYLDFLKENGYKENEVLPMVNLDKLESEKSSENSGALLLFELLVKAKTLSESKDSYEKIRDSFNRSSTIEEEFQKLNNTNSILTKVHKQLIDAFSKLGLDLPKNVFPGVFPTNIFNAECHLRSEGFLILLDTGCFEMIEATSSIIFNSLPISQKVNFLSKWIEDYCILNKLPNQYDLNNIFEDSSSAWLSTHLTTFAEEFVIAHEYGHIVNGNLDQLNRTRTITSKINRRPIQVISKEKEQEFEADLWAAYNLIQTHNDPDIMALAHGGMVVFLGLAYIIEEYRKNQGILNDTHPRADARIFMIDRLFSELSLSEHTYVGRNFFEIVEQTKSKLCGYEAITDIGGSELDRILDNMLIKLKVK